LIDYRTSMTTYVSLSLRLKDLLGPVTRVKKKKKKKTTHSDPLRGVGGN